MHAARFSEAEVRLLARCAHALMHSPDGNKHEAKLFLQYAAEAGDVDSQYHLGLWLARMSASGERADTLPGAASYKEAITWLTRAGEQGYAKAWYAISRIYLKPEFSQRNLDEAYRYVAMAAESGHGPAQYTLGSWLWRTRKGEASRDVQAVYWLQQAEAQGCEPARQLLEKLAAVPAPAPWAVAAQHYLAQEAYRVPQALQVRVKLAARFGLSVAEALLIDPCAADRGHCLEIDIRSHYARGRRRLILVRPGEDRFALDEAVRQLAGFDCRPEGPEGNYRQRLYRLKRLIPDWTAIAET